MGLLNKASIKESSRELSEAGKALRDRILRLGLKKSSAYTALSLLKGYGSFKIGACLELKKDVYESYVSVGLGISKLRIPKDGLTGGKQSFLKISNPESFGFKFFTAGMNLWMFTLDNCSPFRYLLLAVEESGSGFNPAAIALLISETNKVFFPIENRAEPAPERFDLEVPEDIITRKEAIPKEENPAESSLSASQTFQGVEPEETPEGIRTKITGYHQNNTDFQGILLEAPAVAPKSSNAPFAEHVSVMAGAFGPLIVLPSKRVLVLLPPSLDREIVAHRLSKSLGAEVLVCFETDVPDKALELIQPYL
ncbi:hypothetical protein [Treponema primitia]|uniref:hypothetical protein n=1 Tax=Treponema primitia TaxID=88058 RepID=UPI0002554F56|nr:hypothetical protein [Treponema primitia]